MQIEPGKTNALLNLSHCFRKLGNTEQAVNSLETILKYNPKNSTAVHLINALRAKTTTSPPSEYISNLFNQYADKFDESLTNKLNYQIPKLIRSHICDNNNSGIGSVLDLGCGTGLIGAEIRSKCSRLVGVDLSKGMLEIAKSKRIYDNLIHGEVIKYLSEHNLDFDFFIAADVFVYIGDLSRVFELIKKRNKRTGNLVFSTEHCLTGNYHLEQSGRYSHSKKYIKSLISYYGYSLTMFKKIPLRKENQSFIPGALYILKF